MSCVFLVCGLMGGFLNTLLKRMVASFWPFRRNSNASFRRSISAFANASFLSSKALYIQKLKAHESHQLSYKYLLESQ